MSRQKRVLQVAYIHVIILKNVVILNGVTPGRVFLTSFANRLLSSFVRPESHTCSTINFKFTEIQVFIKVILVLLEPTWQFVCIGAVFLSCYFNVAQVTQRFQKILHQYSVLLYIHSKYKFVNKSYHFIFFFSFKLILIVWFTSSSWTHGLSYQNTTFLLKVHFLRRYTLTHHKIRHLQHYTIGWLLHH